MFKESDMDINFNGRCPNCLFPILKFLGLAIGNPWSDSESSHISDLIEEGRFRMAKLLIADMELKYGHSTESVKLGTRIDRIRILGR